MPEMTELQVRGSDLWPHISPLLHKFGTHPFSLGEHPYTLVVGQKFTYVKGLPETATWSYALYKGIVLSGELIASWSQTS